MEKTNRAMQKLISGNQVYMRSDKNPADISPAVRLKTAVHGQHPYAAILTCSDSRVPPEHIFSAGIGELFVVRTAGNVVGGFELGSVEYAVEHLGVGLIVVMGHSQCGAVAAALAGDGHGYIGDIVHEIRLGLKGANDEETAIRNNIVHSKSRLMKSEIIRASVLSGKTDIVCAVYHIDSGRVEFPD